jgi:two-component system invasion response regulator UvrY
MSSEAPDQSEPSIKPGGDPNRILIVDDHPIFRHGIKQMLSRESGIEICGEASNANEALHVMREHQPQVVLIDVAMPGVNLELIKLMLAEQKELRILVLSMYPESLCALQALRNGAKGYLSKPEAVDHLVPAIWTVTNGGVYISAELGDRLIFKAIKGSAGGVTAPIDKLTDREIQVLRLYGKGKSTGEIAGLMGLGVKTVETHRWNVIEKLGLTSTAEMAAFANGWGELFDR